MNPTWTITGCNTRDSEALGPVVLRIHYTVSQDLDSIYGTYDLAQPDPNNFVPFDQLTPGMLLDWLLGVPGLQRAVEADLQQSINKGQIKYIPFTNVE